MTLVLGIESSCDESAAAVLELSRNAAGIVDLEIHSEVIRSQVALHALYGGVVPELASREHLRNLPLVTAEALALAGVDLHDLNAIAVTTGPGLKGCLLIGADFAQGLALGESLKSNKQLPIIPTNHIEGHLLAPLLEHWRELAPPYLALVVSGGHTELLVVHNFGHYELITRTTDDAAGEAFDKSAALLGIPYPGGAELAKRADRWLTAHPDQEIRQELQLPKVMRAPNSGFSFSGLKTAVLLMVKRNNLTLAPEELRDEAAASIQDAIIDLLLRRSEEALISTGLKSLVITGGVAANSRLRQRITTMAASHGARTFLPSQRHCGDNATMIALTAALRGIDKRDCSVEIRSRWPVESLGHQYS